MNDKEQQIIQNNNVVVPGWILYTLLQHLEVAWDSTKLTIPQSEVTINSYRLGSRLLRDLINSKKIHEETAEKVETAEELVDKLVEEEKPKKKRKPKK